MANKWATGELVFESIRVNKGSPALAVERAKVPGGWLVVGYYFKILSFSNPSIAFYPDPEHRWDGGSLSDD